ncbi:MAG: DNRLRE domain-containing protein, partial [Eubacterium sp.]|nr:DNRLRE domain-containing protein [Eubacterium sp.]
MYDSVGESSNDINISLNQENETTYILIINANGDWINDDSREFPVVIDPQIKSKQVDNAIDICCISSVKILSNLADEDNCILGGYDLSYGFTRLLLKFDLPKLDSNDMIVDANLNLYEIGMAYDNEDMNDAQINAHMVKSLWTNSTTWAVQPVYTFEALDHEFLKKSDKKEIDKGNAVLKSWNITKAVKAWYEGDEFNHGIVLKHRNMLSDDGNIFGKFAIDSGKNTNAYPFLTISYKNNKGLENYWTYTSASCGSNDTAYINDFSGNVVAKHIDAQTSGNRAPVTVEHIYNSCNAKQLYTNIYPSCGLGWKLNVQQTIRSSKLYGLTGESQKVFPYVYEDGDGTEHYFYAKTTDNTT